MYLREQTPVRSKGLQLLPTTELPKSFSVDRLLPVSQQFDILIDYFFSGVANISTFARVFETNFPAFQHEAHKKMDPYFIAEERKVSCSPTALMVGKWWEKQAKGNKALYFIQTGDPTSAHCVVALLPPEILIQDWAREYDAYREKLPTAVQFYHFQRIGGQSHVYPMGSKQYFLDQNFYLHTTEESFLQNRLNFFSRK